jgi:hypothetical protein
VKTSEQVNEIQAALAKAQGQMKNPEKNRKASIPMKAGGKYEYNYADLPIVFDTSRAALSSNGLSHTSALDESDRGAILSVRLGHSSGQWYQSSILLPSAADPKSFAANVTYFKRYLFQGLIGVVGDDDLDHEPENAGATYDQRKPANPSSPPLVAPKATTNPQGAPLCTKVEKDQILQAAKQKGVSIPDVEAKMLEMFGPKNPSQLTVVQAQQLTMAIVARGA